MTVHSEDRSAWAYAQSDQSSLSAQWVDKDPAFLHADSKDSDQTVRMPRLILVFAGRKAHFVGFLMRWLNFIAILQVLMYTGQLDIIVAIPLTEAFLMTVPWDGLPEYKAADRLVWKINPADKEVAGYVRQVRNFYQVGIWAASWENLFMPYANNKGADQPAHPCSLISTFVVRCLDSMILLVSISEISSFYLASVAAQAGLCLV